MLVAWVEERYRTSCPSFDTCHAISPISPVNELKKFPDNLEKDTEWADIVIFGNATVSDVTFPFFHEAPLQHCYQANVLFDTSFKNSGYYEPRRYDERHCEE